MRPFSFSYSKTMMPFFGVPILEHLFQGIRASGIFGKVLLTSKGRDNDILLHVGDGSALGLQIFYPPMKGWAGTAGAVRCLIDELPDSATSPIVVVYGDSLLQIDFSALVAFHLAKSASFTMACHSPRFDAFLFEGEGGTELRTNFGVAELDSGGKVLHFEEKPLLATIAESFEHPTANAAVYVVDPEVLRSVPSPEGRLFDFAYHVIPWLVERGERVVGLNIAPGFRVDLGTLQHYLSMHMAVLRGEVQFKVPATAAATGLRNHADASIHPLARLITPVFVDCGARIESHAEIESSVIGECAVVREGAVIRDSILLGHTVVGAGAMIERSILGRHCSVAPATLLPRGTVVGDWSVIGGDELELSSEIVRGLLAWHEGIP